MIKGVLLDMDGVLYHGTRRLDGALEFLQWLPVPFAFVTNNSSRTPEQVAGKLARMEIVVNPAQIFTSSLATANYMIQQYPIGTPVLAIGEAGLFTALQQAGFTLTTESPRIVVVGLDREFNAEKLQVAANAIRSGADFIGTNMDMMLMTEKGKQPGTGTIVTQVAEATGQKPLVMGKPERQIFDMAANYLQLGLQEILMVGDNLLTDIQGANQHGMQSAFVLTGVSKSSELQLSDLKVDYVAIDLNDLKTQLTILMQ